MERIRDCATRITPYARPRSLRSASARPNRPRRSRNAAQHRRVAAPPACSRARTVVVQAGGSTPRASGGTRPAPCRRTRRGTWRSSRGRARFARHRHPSGVHAISIAPFVRKTSRPPRRSRRLASGTHSCGSHQRLAPYSETTASKLSASKERFSAFSQISGNERSNSCWNRRTVSSCGRATSTATGRRPFRASHAEICRGAAAELDDVCARGQL